MRTTLAYWTCFLFSLIQSANCAAQTNYADYQKAEVVSSDQFDQAYPPGWKQSGYEVTGGWAMRTHKSKGLALKTIELNESRDFELELSASLTFEKGVFPKVYFGDFIMVSTCLNQFGQCNTGLMFWNKADAYEKYLDPKHEVAPQIPFNFASAKPFLVTIRKIGGMVYFFINQELLATASYKPFSQQTFGVHMVRSIDFVTLHYLKKSVDELAVTQPAVRQTASPVQTGPAVVKAGGKYYALLIGVSQYQDTRLNLPQPALDARKLRELLVTNYTFSDSTTFLVLDPSRQKILSELFRLRKIVGPNDNLLIFYGGHGYWDEAVQQGYWWPSDARAEDPSNWLSNSDVREQIRGIKSGHTLLISDACFSGGLFKTRSANIRDAGIDFQYLYKMPSRRAITSGTMTTVPDKSVFFQYLTKRLQDNQEPFLTSQQLFDSFRLAVINNSMAVPQDGVITETGDEGGDFVFIKK